MPELPEVETVKRTLIPLTVGKTIQHVQVFWPNIIKKPDVVTFAEMLQGQTIQSVERRGKFLKFLLDELVLVSHLRMEGRYLLQPSTAPIEPHTHVIFQFTDGTELRYRDVRKFGTMHLFKAFEIMKCSSISSIFSFTPTTIVTSSFFPGAVKITRFAPASK